MIIEESITPYVGYDFLKQNRIRTASNPFKFKGDVIGWPFSLGDLINADLKRIIPEEVGIYHLFKDDILVYIGMSKNIKKRILGHFRQKEMDFDNVLWFCSKNSDNKTVADTFRVERKMIKYHKPFYNEAYLSGF